MFKQLFKRLKEIVKETLSEEEKKYIIISVIVILLLFFTGYVFAILFIK